jgi:putative Ca2+/H+ antiporter (TMEM165/GDT1 family)
MIYTAKIKYWILFIVASLAMSGLHTLSVLVGLAVHQFIPRLATQIIAIILFWLLGGWSIF